ncbi:PAS domain S-box-containing protein [Mariprofundus aestuarium]|uniref:histidine kinase n=1 Tax=Mariprofundus aestuarium TaxID=1921086 RepID=A0A2K8KY20_MARES|nr:ATP-binding protein [Mariprofundus aestuarium]ATX78769.1 PAS domain S-box-containing protein [Mariprofundus aestuarium]
MRTYSTNRVFHFASIAGALITALLLMLAYNKLAADAEVHFFEESAQIREQLLLQNLHANEVADNIISLFRASDYVEPDEFQIVAEDQLLHYPYILSVAFLPHVLKPDVGAFEKEMQKIGFVTYAVRGSSGISDHSSFPVKYIEPMTPLNASLLGLDMASIGKYGPHISKAIHTRSATASSFEHLAKSGITFTLFKPVFTGITAVNSDEINMEEVSALVAVKVNATALMNTVTIPQGFNISWKILDTFHHPVSGKEHLLVKNTVEQGSHLLFKSLQSEPDLAFGAVESTLIFEKRIYWKDTEYQYLLAAFATGLVLTLLLLFAARGFQLRDRELQQRNEEIEKQVRKKTRDLQQSEASMNDAQRIARVGSWELDLTNNELKWSDEIFRIFEVDKEAFGASYEAFIDAIHPNDRELVNSKYTDSVASRLPYDIEHRLLLKGGRIKHVHEHCQTIYNNEGTPIRSSGTVQDITERKELEEQLLQSQKLEAIGTLAGGIAHDFNNTLAAIQGNLYLAKKQMGNKELVSTKLSNIETLGIHAAEIVKQLLTFARKDMVNTRPFSLTSFLSTELSLFKSIIPENIDYTIDLCDEGLTIRGDSAQLQQALVNLLNNARDAVRNTEQPKINLMLESFTTTTAFQQKHRGIKGERLAHLIVSDNGSGIPKAALEHVFEPFYTTKGVGEGTGLGLAMVYGSIQTHGGTIEIESEQGKGSTFHIYLPLCQEDEKVLEEPEKAPVPGEGETILLVDDDDEVRSTTREVLESMDYRVLTASNGQEGLEIFHANQNDIDVIISDVVMPKMGGAELARRAKEIDSDIQVILITGYDDQWAAEAQGASEHTEIVLKPLSFPKLSQTLRTIIESSERTNS